MKCRVRCSVEACFLRAADGYHSVQQVAGSLAGCRFQSTEIGRQFPAYSIGKNRRRNQFSESQNCSEFQAVKFRILRSPCKKFRTGHVLILNCRADVLQQSAKGTGYLPASALGQCQPISGTGAADSQKHSTSQIQKGRHNVTTRAIPPG